MKAKWADLDIDDIESAEGNSGGYTGEVPPAGLYRFEVAQMKQATSGAGNDKVVVLLKLDGSWKPEKHSKFNGCPVFDHLPVTKSAAWRVKALCDALGVTASDFIRNVVVDEEGVITKIGPKVIQGKKVLVYANTRVEPAQGEYDESLRLKGAGYLPKADDAVEDSAEDVEEKPKAKKAKGESAEPKADKASKKGKKGKKDDDEPPF